MSNSEQIIPINSPMEMLEVTGKFEKPFSKGFAGKADHVSTGVRGD